MRSSWAIGSAQVHAAVDVGVVALRGGGQVTDRHARRRRDREQPPTEIEMALRMRVVVVACTLTVLLY